MPVGRCKPSFGPSDQTTLPFGLEAQHARRHRVGDEQAAAGEGDADERVAVDANRRVRRLGQVEDVDGAGGGVGDVDAPVGADGDAVRLRHDRRRRRR